MILLLTNSYQTSFDGSLHYETIAISLEPIADTLSRIIRK